MSTNKTTNLGLHSWAGNDNVRRVEFNENFTKLDEEVGDLKKGIVVIESLNTTNKTTAGAINEINTSIGKKADKTDVDNISVPIQSVNAKTGDVVLAAVDIKAADGKSLEQFKTEAMQSMSDLENDINEIATNRDSATDGKVLTSNGDGTSTFKDINIGKNYRTIITQLDGTPVSDDTKLDTEQFLEVTSKQSIEIRNLDVKAFVETDLDFSELIKGQVTVEYNGEILGGGSLGQLSYKKVIDGNVKITVEDEGFCLKSATYDNVFATVSGEASSPRGLAFSKDGTKLFVLGSNNSNVYEYVLSVPYDIATLSYNNIYFNIGGQTLGGNGLCLSADGTKMFIVGSSNDSIFQYSMATPYDLSTASYDNKSYTVSSISQAPEGITISKNGKYLYIVEATYNTIHQFDLIIPNDITGMAHSKSFIFSDTSGKGIYINNTGDKMFVNGNQGDCVYQYRLKVPFDISSTYYENVVLYIVGNPEGLTFSHDGSKMYSLDGYKVYQYTTKEAFNGKVYVKVKY